jgi:hypothetical protein
MNQRSGTKVWEMYSAQQHSLQDAPIRSISLFTLQAMLFAACSFVTPESLHMVGSRSVQHVQEILYRHFQVGLSCLFVARGIICLFSIVL